MEDQNRFEPVKRAAERHNVDAVARYRGLNRLCCFGSWGLRPRLYAYARYRGLRVNTVAWQAKTSVAKAVLYRACRGG